MGIPSAHDRGKGNLVVTDLSWIGKTIDGGTSSIAVGGDVHEDAHRVIDGWGEYRLCFVGVADGTGSGTRPRGSRTAGPGGSGDASDSRDARDACGSSRTGGSRCAGLGRVRAERVHALG